MNKALLIYLCACLPVYTEATPAAHRFTVGKLEFAETPKKLAIKTVTGEQFASEVLPGGGMWPPVLIDEGGRVNVGHVRADAATGRRIAPTEASRKEINIGNGVAVRPSLSRLIIANENKSCSLPPSSFGFSARHKPLDLLKSRDLLLATSDKEVLALTRQTTNGGDGDRKDYAVRKVDLRACKVALLAELGDPDYLVELAWSKTGGWWISGAKEQTLLRSRDGVDWQHVEVDEKISALVSSYVKSDNEIWLAAVMPAVGIEEPYDLIYSPDAGKSWLGVRTGEKALARIPGNWLEGLRRATYGNKD